MNLKLNKNRYREGMVRFITGKTGGGKTKLAVWKLIEELRYTDRPIVTNMALRLDPWVNAKGTAYKGLIRTLLDEFGEDFNACQRIHFITAEDMRRFWSIRPLVPKEREGTVTIAIIPEDTEEKDCKKRRFHNDGRFPGVAFFIDEAHEFLAQGDWQEMAGEGMSWLSQNRRSGDDAWFLTQEAELVAKPVRRQSLECYWMINHGYRKLGPFRQPDVISWRLHVSTPPRESEPALDVGTIKFKEGLLNGCYDTASGAGVSGTIADLGARKPGLHWAWIPAGAVGIMLACGFGFVAVRGLVGKFVTMKVPQVAERVVQPFQLKSTVSQAEVARASNVPPATKLSVVDGGKAHGPTEKVISIIRGRAGTAVTFDDGSSVLSQSVKEAGRDVVIDGVLYGRVWSPKGATEEDRKERERRQPGQRSLF